MTQTTAVCTENSENRWLTYALIAIRTGFHTVEKYYMVDVLGCTQPFTPQTNCSWLMLCSLALEVILDRMLTAN